MEPQSQSPETPQPPEAKPQVAAAKVGAGVDAPPGNGNGGEAIQQAGTAVRGGGGGTRSRHFPRPPALLPRLLMLCVRPETWAEMARYPSRFTIVPLVLAILISAIGVGMAEGVRSLDHLEQFAATYDSRYPALEITSEGVLTAKGPLAAPIRFENGIDGETILVDPTGNTLPATVKTPRTCLITSREFFLFVQAETPPVPAKLAELKGWLPPAGQTQRIDGAIMEKFFAENRGGYVTSMTIVWGGFVFIRNALWAALMMFLLSPLVMLAAAGPKLPSVAGVQSGPDRRLLLPRRATYRIAGAVLVPLVIFGGAMQVAGHPVTSLLGHEGATLFWFFSAAALCLWAGVMAKGMYGVKKR